MAWKDEDAIDTLAAAYAETGDFDLAVRYAAQALSVKGISAEDAKFFGNTWSYSSSASGSRFYNNVEQHRGYQGQPNRGGYLPMRIKIPAASARIPMMMVGMVM